MADLVERYPEAGLVVSRAAVDKTILAAALAEAKEIQAISRVFARGYRTQQGTGSPEEVHQASRHIDELRDSGCVAIAGLFQTWRPGALHCPTITVNRQSPYSFQRFHTDGHIGSPVMVHLSDGGRFDYVISDENPYLLLDRCNRLGYEGYDTIELNAGDVVELSNSDLIHRGRNATNLTRFNVGLYDSGEV